MKVLLDTCTFLWICNDDPLLSPYAREIFEDPMNEVYLSVASAWEIAIKHAFGKLSLSEVPEQFIPTRRKTYDVESLPLVEEAALHVYRLPLLHRDPFDRMLVSQAVVGGLIILTPDTAIRQYAVACRW